MDKDGRSRGTKKYAGMSAPASWDLEPEHVTHIFFPEKTSDKGEEQ